MDFLSFSSNSLRPAATILSSGVTGTILRAFAMGCPPVTLIARKYILVKALFLPKSKVCCRNGMDMGGHSSHRLSVLRHGCLVVRRRTKEHRSNRGRPCTVG